jgi:hypothetical protein
MENIKSKESIGLLNNKNKNKTKHPPSKINQK